MKKLILALFFAWTLSAASSDKDVLAALDGWKQAMLHSDVAAMDKVLHKDLTFTHSSGGEQKKADVLEAVAHPKYKTDSIEFSDTTVRTYGDTAIVKTNVTMTSSPNGTARTSKLIVLNVFVKTPQGWQLVARQATAGK
jgi:uncharacterized protein (TIGR02246 family)